MEESLRKFVRYEGKLFWVDLETYEVMVINADGSFRPLAQEDGSVFEIMAKGEVAEPAESMEASAFFRATSDV